MRRGGRDAKLTASVHNDRCACQGDATNAFNKRSCLYRPNANGVGLAPYPRAADVDIVTSSSEKNSSTLPKAMLDEPMVLFARAL